MGFDNDIYAEICKPKLTTVSVDIISLASSSISSLLARIESNNADVRRKVIPGHLVFRDSVKELCLE